jgi:hypothetical protein
MLLQVRTCAVVVGITAMRRKSKKVVTRGGLSLYGVRGKQGAGLIYCGREEEEGRGKRI